MKKLLGIVVLGLFLSSNAYANTFMTYNEYKKNLVENPVLAENYLKGVFDAIRMMNSISDKKSKLFCHPEGFVLRLENGKDIIEQMFQKNPSLVKDEWIVILLISGLKDLFPCK